MLRASECDSTPQPSLRRKVSTKQKFVKADWSKFTPTKAASVSTPVTWDEIERGITSEQFTMDVVLKRVERHGDLFAPVLSGKAKLPV